MLVHVPPQELYNQSGFPSIFLHGWDFYFFDTCTPGSAFHLQKMLQIVSSPKKQFKEPSKYILCDLNVLFDDCLWDFCTRIQIFLPQLPREMFTDENAYDFYRNQTSTTKRVECLKKILQRLTQLQEQMMNIYHEQLSKKKNSSQSPYNIIYQMSKDILCGKRLIGLVDALQLQIRASLTNFVSNLLKYLANDYGLETLSKLSAKQNNVGSTLNLIDYTSFALDVNINEKSPSPTQGIFQLVTHYELDCKAADELCIRHLLVNLMAMIIKGGAKSFLWTFAFQPLAIENTFVKKLIPNKISITQIALYNTGVITLNDRNCSWIDQILRASLMLGKNYFPKLDTSFNFDFAYIQSYIIRTYLLLCHINYQHIAQKYQLYEPRKMTPVVLMYDDETFDLDENYSVPLEDDWTHLNDMLMDKLYHGYNLLKRIASIIKNESTDSSSVSVYELIQSIPQNESLMQQLVQYDVRDFKLCHLNLVGKLYRTLIKTFEYSFANIPDLLRIPIDADLSNTLQQIFETKLLNVTYEENIDDLQSHIQHINQFLYDLKSIEDILLQQSNESLRLTCTNMGVDNDIATLIPEEIKCENYISLTIYLNQVQSILQERKINIEEKTAHLWEENFHSDRNEQDIIEKNRYHRYLHGKLETQSDYSMNSFNSDDSDNEDDTTDEPDILQYSSLFQLHINRVPITSFKQVSERNDQQAQQVGPLKKVQKFVITHPDGKSQSCLCKCDNLYEQLRKTFKERKYDSNTYAVVDNNRILFDLTNDNNPLPMPLPVEYCIVEKAMLLSIEFRLGTQSLNYTTMADCHFYSLTDRLVNNQNLKLLSCNSRYCFYDEIGRFIDGGNIGDLYRENGELPIVIQIEEQDDSATLFEITLTSNRGLYRISTDYLSFIGEKKTNVFHPMIKWQHIEVWRKLVLPEIESSCVYWNRDNESINDENQSIASLEIPVTNVDGISQDQTMHIIFSFGIATQHIRTLKSMTIARLLNNRYWSNLDMHTSLNDCCLSLSETMDKILSEVDLQKSVGAYQCNDSETIHFRVLVRLNILINDDQQKMEIFLKDSTTTIEQLLQQIQMVNSVDRYLASNDTHRIYQNNEIVINLNTKNFLLVKENETCIVLIESRKNDN
ncbi:unnamed protein product [Rotaria sp. Silwood1]|nr:unnamed protein product [Rotaria sp. Silwood1]